jgi:hypothetical protein
MANSSEKASTDAGQPVSVDETIDEIARRALEEARRKEELERLRKEHPAARDSASYQSSTKDRASFRPECL